MHDHRTATRRYDELAPEYDRRWSRYIEATIRETLVRTDVPRGARVLDVGCGTGAFLEALAREAPTVRMTGVDPSTSMLAVARRRLGQGPVLACAAAERLPLPDASQDLVVSTNAFHYFREPERALGEMRRVLDPAGRLVVTDWCDDYLACKVCDLWLRLFDPAHFRTYGREACRRMLEEAGFRIFELDRYKIDWLWGLMTAVAEKDRPSPERGGVRESGAAEAGRTR